MNTQQQFFTNIVHSNAITFEAIDKIIGDLNKNIGLSAAFFENASWIIGNTTVENYDLSQIFGDYAYQVASDTNDALKQSLQNSISGVGHSTSYASFNVCTHISTTLLNYSFGLSSAFLSAQIYSFPSTGLTSTSIISVPYDFSLSGNQFNSHVTGTPLDIAVYGVENFNGAYTGTKLTQFTYSWSYCLGVTSLIVCLNYSSALSNPSYLQIYWGNSDANFISTGLTSSGGIYYSGQSAFINNVGVLTTNVKSSSLTQYSGRKNFWSNQVPYKLDFENRSFSGQGPYLWAADRINATLVDGVASQQDAPLRYPVTNEFLFSDVLTNTNNYNYVYSDFVTTGTGNNQGVNAYIRLSNLFGDDIAQKINESNIERVDENSVPLSLITFEKDPKKAGLNYSNGYVVSEYNQVLPSAFLKVVEDPYIWEAFANSLINTKNYYISAAAIKRLYLNTLDNFIADFFFGSNFNDVDVYFTGQNLVISNNALKYFMQPYGFNNNDPVNLTEYEEKSIYDTTKIVASREFATFSEGVLTMLNDFKLPANHSFEIYKPISFVCNGIDPYDQGTGFALDYTLNLTFQYQNQNYLNKTLYLMASKYLISENEYNTRIDNNQDTFGYYYLADPDSKDYSDYSVSSINEFRLYGYSGLIPDLKDGVSRPILCRAFSPKDTQKYTYEEYVAYLNSIGITNQDDINEKIQEYLDEGNSFYVVDLDTHSSEFVLLEDISICATNYTLNGTKYWNDQIPNPYRSLYGTEFGATGFVNLTANILGGTIDSVPSSPGPYTIANIPVGYNCRLSEVAISSVGKNQKNGTYTQWINVPANVYTIEQPVQLEYVILSNGNLDTTSIKILNYGANYSFGFGTFLTAAAFTTVGLGETHPYVVLNMDNISYFNAVVDASNTITSMVMSNPPPIGYRAGFKFNPRALVGLGYTSDANVNILLDYYPTVDSFIIGEDNLTVGDLENYSSFETPITNLDSLNYSSGEQYYNLYEDEIFNTIEVASTYGSKQISFVSINCKVIEKTTGNPSGSISMHIYALSGTEKTKVASSDEIPVSALSRSVYDTIDIPLEYSFTNTFYSGDGVTYWISIKQNLKNCVLSLQGSYLGISTSNFYVDSQNLFNSPNDLIICGGISTTGYDLDLGKFPVGITSIFGVDTLAQDTNTVVVYLRKDPSYVSAKNNIYIGVNSTYLSSTSNIYSNNILASSLSTTFVGYAFTFASNLSAGTVINYANVMSSNGLSENQIFIARSLANYDISAVGFATSSQVSINGSIANFNFVFNKLFSQVSNQKYAAFNYTDPSQFGLAKPNRLRVADPINVVDGYWSYYGKDINKPLSIYPRAAYSIATVIGTSSPTYAYLGYSHNIYVNLGYNSGGQYIQEGPITLLASPKWKTIWMSRGESDYKNFNIYNVINNTYRKSIDYVLGSATTNIGFNTSYKSAIFEGTFKPNGNTAIPLPISIGIGTQCGIQLYLNNSPAPIIDTFSVSTSDYQTINTNLDASFRENEIYFKALYYTFSTAAITISWNVGLGTTYINSDSSQNTAPAPYSLNSGRPIDNIVFFNVSKTIEDATSVNSGYPTGDSFIIRSS